MDHPVRRGLRRSFGAALLALTLAGTAACSTLDDADPGSSSDDATSAVEDKIVTPKRYVALGDSFTSAPFVPDSFSAEGCFRSTGNYPALVAKELPETEVVDVSCSGADTTHLTGPQSTALGGQVPPQFEALTEETDLVTVGIGGNDFEVYGTMTSTCPTLAAEDQRGAPCRDEMRRGGKDTLLASIERTGKRVTKVVEGIRERSPDARILLVNYPQLTPTKGRCEALPLARGDYAYSVEVGGRLDSVLRDVAEQTEVELVDLWSASEGHDICSDEPWTNGSLTDFARALEYHPFAEGQRAAADLVLETLGLS
ncbi:SGNH/GDSL hydrolase family protein [Nocardioides gilvus]|uniref:SGNH/GDSL hydrolase family protein n=1 Tax=Nocardioides gilvus TaxID=1735589 RepID=UPI000D74F649|nr:SGNH/GDSL hydrolase family protein [Nocardioides gilvus]